MSLVGDFLRSHRRPTAVFHRRLASTSEASALAILILALVISFLGRIPALLAAPTTTASSLPPTLAAAFMGGVFFGALLLYAIAALFRFLMPGPEPGLQARIVVFWSLLVLAPWGSFVSIMNAQLAHPILVLPGGILLVGGLGLQLLIGCRVARQPATVPSKTILQRASGGPQAVQS